MKIVLTFFLIICFSLSFPIRGQDIYRSKLGTLLIEVPLSDRIMEIHTRGLNVNLDYENAQFDLELNPDILHTGIDSLDQKLREGGSKLIRLTGKLGLESINTSSHPPQHFQFTGQLGEQGNQIMIQGTGHLEHVDGGEEFTCLLGLQFEMEPSLFLEGEIVHQITGNIKVQLIQTILKKMDI